jgi:6-phosphofructokinase 1
VGGDGTLKIGQRLWEKGMPLVGVPKTIDNDVRGTVITFGFDTAVSTATDAIDKLHSTAESHQRVFVVEVMGRHAGWIALNSGLAGTADVILIPEIPFDIARVCDKIRAREVQGRHFSIVVAAEGAKPKGGAEVLREAAVPGGRLGGSAKRSRQIERRRQGNAERGTRPSAARRLAHDLRPVAGTPIRRGGRPGRRGPGVRPDGGARPAPDPDRPAGGGAHRVVGRAARS